MQVKNTMEQLRTELANRERDLLQQLELIRSTKISALQTQIRTISEMRDDAKSCQEVILKAKKKNNDVKLLALKKPVMDYLEEAKSVNVTILSLLI
jgi:hypothetical protein